MSSQARIIDEANVLVWQQNATETPALDPVPPLTVLATVSAPTRSIQPLYKLDEDARRIR